LTTQLNTWSILFLSLCSLDKYQLFPVLGLDLVKIPVTEFQNVDIMQEISDIVHFPNAKVKQTIPN
jgi:hypothetical protein